MKNKGTVQILNPWKSTPENKEYYELNEPIYTNGDWSAYSHFYGSVIVAYKNIAVNNLIRLDKGHIDRLATNQRPACGYPLFLFDRSMEIRDFGLSLL